MASFARTEIWGGAATGTVAVRAIAVAVAVIVIVVTWKAFDDGRREDAAEVAATILVQILVCLFVCWLVGLFVGLLVCWLVGLRACVSQGYYYLLHSNKNVMICAREVRQEGSAPSRPPQQQQQQQQQQQSERAGIAGLSRKNMTCNFWTTNGIWDHGSRSLFFE
jgi:hypothetical protein